MYPLGRTYLLNCCSELILALPPTHEWRLADLVMFRTSTGILSLAPNVLLAYGCISILLGGTD